MATWSASQTGREQDEDVSTGFREFHKKLRSHDAERYRQDFAPLEEFAKKTLTTATDITFTSGQVSMMAANLVRAQYAHNSAFNVKSRTDARRKTGHWPTSVGAIFDNHPGMSQLDEDEKQEYSDLIPTDTLLFARQGYLLETDMDNSGIPETKEQASKRAKGQSVKIGLKAPWRSRCAWINHEGTEASRTSYDYTGDFQCSHCSGYWSTWVKFDLTSGKRKWMTPG